MGKTILVTGANGNVSSHVIAALKGTKNNVRALVRTEEKGAALKKAGVEIVIGDLGDSTTLPKAFAGVDSVFLLTSNGPQAPMQMSHGIYAARKANVSHIVRMSAIGAAHNAPTINSRCHALSDNELAVSGIPYTILKPHFFMQNLMMSAPSVAKDGAMYWALGEGKMSLIDTRDIGEFAAKVLVTGGHESKTYTLVGPQSLSMTQVAEQVGAAIGKKVNYVPVTIEQAAGSMAQMGMDTYSVNMMVDYMRAYAADWGDFLNNDFHQLMGKQPRSWADFAKEFAGAFGGK